MSSQRPQGQIIEGQGRTAVHLGARGETPTPYDNARLQSDPVDHDLFCVDQKLYHMSVVISEARATVHASRSKIASSTERYEQKLRAWYQACEDLKAKHEAAIVKLKEDCYSVSRQLEVTREAIKNREWEMQRSEKEYQRALKQSEDRAEITEKKLFDLEKEKAVWMRDRREEVAAAEVLGVIAAPGKEIADQIQDYRNLLAAEQRSQIFDDGRQIPETRTLTQIPSASSTNNTPARISRKRRRSDSGRHMSVEHRNRNSGREGDIDQSTIVVQMGEDNV